MLLISTLLMTTTSYAWFILSTAPEVTGITTNVGANGSLEIALLNTETRSNMSAIRAGVGDSLVANNLAANNAWGNLIDLGFVDYGLGDLLLMPARLNVTANANNGSYTVDPGMLTIPTYGYDGRIVDLTDNTVTAVYQNNQFMFEDGKQDYGVRAIGTSDMLSVQGSALAIAKSNIATYTKSAVANTTAALSNSSDAVFDIVVQYFADTNAVYEDVDRDALKVLLADLEKSLADIDAALRQGLVAMAASIIEDEDTFNTVKDRAMDLSVELKQILADVSEVTSVPENFNSWVNDLDQIHNNLNVASNTCNNMTGGAYSFAQIREVLDYIMNINGVLVEGGTLAEIDPNELILMDTVVMTLAPGSGIFADIAEFVGNYNVIAKIMGIKDVVIATAYDEDQGVYLKELSEYVNGLEAAGDSGSTSAVLTSTYGYALDLAFRCNAEGADLILQTNPKQRIYNQEGQESTSASTQGGGSYMEFSSTSLEDLIPLMDAIRVGFLDHQSTLLGIAKLNTSNWRPGSEDGMIQADLYLYDYVFEQDETGLSLIMGERRNIDNTIVTKEDMEKNVPEALTVVVWLDGDLVDNSMVSATEAASLTGVLNLQFATNATLVPAKVSELLNYTADKSGLSSLIQDYAEIYSAGQGTYTTVSWNAFSTAYYRATSVNDSDSASQTQIRNAMINLAKAADGLEIVSQEPVTNKIAQLRAQMGETEDLVYYVIQDENGNVVAAGNEEHTQEVHDSWDILGEVKRVDYGQNLQDEGNEIYTPIYTDESWSSLANALYEAERLTKDKNATDEQLNAALSAIEISEKALERRVFYKPYEYKGVIYYEAICEAENADTYGKWYDSSFKRIVSDMVILNLDAYAVPATVSQINQNQYVSNKTGEITPQIEILDQIYTELQDEEIIGIKWGVGENAVLEKGADDTHIVALNNLLAIVKAEGLESSNGGTSGSGELKVDTSAAKKLIERYEKKEQISRDEAEMVIENLNNAITKALEERDKNDTAYMTASQRILLTTAVNAAKAIEGYNGNAALKTAAEAAESRLSDAKTTEEAAKTALTALNAQLKAAGVNEVTEYNTLTHKIPESSDVYDVVYDVEYPGIVMNVMGKNGTETISAQILTQNGVVIHITKNIIVYEPADGVEILHDEKAVDGELGLELEAGKQAELSARLFYQEKEPDENTPGTTDEGDNAGNTEGTNPEGTGTANILDRIDVPENVKSCRWASSDASVAEVTNKEAQTCTIEALTEGTTTISISVETSEGNTYTMAFELKVNAPSGPNS